MFDPEKHRKTLEHRPRRPRNLDDEPRPTVRRPVYKPQLFGGWGPKL
jgi:hypothetical protein